MEDDDETTAAQLQDKLVDHGSWSICVFDHNSTTKQAFVC